jgi:hypothetical protein
MSKTIGRRQSFARSAALASTAPSAATTLAASRSLLAVSAKTKIVSGTIGIASRKAGSGDGTCRYETITLQFLGGES